MMTATDMQDRDEAGPIAGETEHEPAAPYIREYGLLALVQDHETSVRLRNSIEGAVETGDLPFDTVGDYLDAGQHAEPVMLRNVRNFGRKTARELDALVREVLVSRAEPASSVRQSVPILERELLLALLGNETIEELSSDQFFSTRLANVLSEPTLARMRFVDFVEDFNASIGLMLRQQNCGRKSTQEFRSFCERHISERLVAAGHAGTTPLVGWLLGGPDPFRQAMAGPWGTSQGAPILAEATPSIPSTPEHDRLADRLEWLLDELDTRARMIIRRRNGIGQERCDTLEEIGSDASVTRERIRQIEAKSLRRIRVRTRHVPIAPLLAKEGPAVWSTLVGGERFLRRTDGLERRRALDPYVRLALEITEIRLDEWLDRIAQPMLHGWLAPDADVAAVESASEALAAVANAPLPQALAMLVEADAVPAARAAAILIRGQPVRYDYLMPQRVGVRLTRLVRLHALLAGGEPSWLDLLLQRYRTIFDDDPCGERDAEIVMNAAPHLFLEIEDGYWSSIGTTSARLPSAQVTSVPLTSRNEENGTIAQALRSTLQRRGPTRLVELMDDALEILPQGRSINSIGPVLLTRRELFARALPGVYALPEQIPTYSNAMPEDWPVLFNDTQARLYAVARYAGEPRRIFPLWSAAVEYALCRWARHSGGVGIYPSLLSVAKTEDWPIDPDLRQDWRRLQQLEGRYCLGVGLRHGAAYELPGLERVFAACRHAAGTGQFSWVAGNRLTGRKIDSHGGAGLVALLLRLGVIEEAETAGFRWQRPHRTTSFASELCSRLDAAFNRLGVDADWSSAIGKELVERASVRRGRADWVDESAFLGMFSGSPAPGRIDGDDDDPLAKLLAEQRRAREVERRESTLDWLLGE